MAFLHERYRRPCFFALLPPIPVTRGVLSVLIRLYCEAISMFPKMF
jgi:hypothetical protein